VGEVIFVKKGKGYKALHRGRIQRFISYQKLNFFKDRASFEKAPGQ
jgi:hypothetical protein